MKIFDFIPFDSRLTQESVNDINRLILRVTDIKLVQTCFNLFDDEKFEQIEAIFIDNPTEESYQILLNQKEVHFFVGFDSDFNYESHGILFVNTHAGKSYFKLTFRYLMIYKDTNELFKRADNIWSDNWIIKFLTTQPSLLDNMSETDLKLLDLKQSIYHTYDLITLQTNMMNSIQSNRSNELMLLEEEIKKLKENISANEEELQKLRWQYDQTMLSKVVKGEIDAEANSWWMNRY